MPWNKKKIHPKNDFIYSPEVTQVLFLRRKQSHPPKKKQIKNKKQNEQKRKKIKCDTIRYSVPRSHIYVQ